MSPTRTLRRQHAALIDLVGQLSASLEPIRTLDDAQKSSRVLAKMTGVLIFHLAAEDESLYPRLIASDRKVLSATAKRFSTEMGGLADTYSGFCEKWASSSAIFEAPDEYKNEAKLIITALTKRIEREDEILYPLLDSLEDEQS